MPLSFIILLAVFFLIAIRQWLPVWVGIWQIMLAGAVLMLACGQISLAESVKLVQWEVIAFLFGVFSIGAGLQKTGILAALCAKLLHRPRALSHILLGFMIFTALASALFTNDTVAVIGTAIALLLAKQTQTPPLLFLFALCFSLTIGGALTPIGNPQNMLIAVQGGLTAPFSDFFIYAAAPTLLSFIISFFWLRWLFRRAFKTAKLHQVNLPTLETTVAKWPVLLSVLLFILLLLYYSLSQFIPSLPDLSIALVGLIACLPSYLFSRQRLSLLAHTDWRTLLFFIAMFMVVGTVWHSNIIQHVIENQSLNLRAPLPIFVISSVASQIISNVPLVELYLTYLGQSSPYLLMALSISSTLAGNLFIISAASTVIVIQQAERENDRSITFWNFCAAGLPLTLVTLCVSYGWLYLLRPHGNRAQ